MNDGMESKNGKINFEMKNASLKKAMQDLKTEKEKLEEKLLQTEKELLNLKTDCKIINFEVKKKSALIDEKLECMQKDNDTMKEKVIILERKSEEMKIRNKLILEKYKRYEEFELSKVNFEMQIETLKKAMQDSMIEKEKLEENNRVTQKELDSVRNEVQIKDSALLEVNKKLTDAEEKLKKIQDVFDTKVADTPLAPRKTCKRVSDEDFHPSNAKASKKMTIQSEPIESVSPLQKRANTPSTKFKAMAENVSSKISGQRVTRSCRKLYDPDLASSSESSTVSRGKK